MKLRKKAICMLAGITLLSSANVENISAFKTASHYALIQTATDDLPSNSRIREAIEVYPEIAAWGAIGPDLGYAQVRAAAGYAPWADRFHYDKVGSLAAELLKEALSSGDQKELAFAAGWLSHECGDIACHGMYVNPECGVYMDNESTRSQHAKLEEMAEPYVWNQLASLPLNDYCKSYFPRRFASSSDIPFYLLNSACQKVYGKSESTSAETGWTDMLITSYKTGVGYSYVGLTEATDFLNQNGRKKNLENAFSTATTQTVTLLTQAEKGNYSNFSDRWNLDVGKSTSPISALTVTVKTGTKSGAGTDDDIYFGIELKSGAKKRWLLDKAGYDDFENGDNDDYYLYINDKNITPSTVKRVYIEKVNVSSNGQNWYLQSFKVNANGKDVFSTSVGKWMDKNASVYYDANFSGISNTSDPVF